MNMLLALDLDPNAQSDMGHTALHGAAHKGHSAASFGRSWTTEAGWTSMTLATVSRLSTLEAGSFRVLRGYL